MLFVVEAEILGKLNSEDRDHVEDHHQTQQAHYLQLVQKVFERNEVDQQERNWEEKQLEVALVDMEQLVHPLEGEIPAERPRADGKAKGMQPDIDHGKNPVVLSQDLLHDLVVVLSPSGLEALVEEPRRQVADEGTEQDA